MKILFEIIFLAVALIAAAVFKDYMRVSVEAASRKPFKVLMWGVFGGAAFAVVTLLVLGFVPKEREIVLVLLLLPFLAYLYALGSVGLVRLIWPDAFSIRYIIIPVMIGFGYLAKIALPFGGKVNMGLFAFGFGCLVAGLGHYDREDELAGHREREEGARERPAVSGSTKKMADITPIFKDQDGRYPGAPPEGD